MIIIGLYGKIKMEPVDSSMISAIGFDYRHHDLYVQFSSGKIYVYRAVPIREFETLRTASSVGGYYNDNIKGQYASGNLEVLLTNQEMPEIRKATGYTERAAEILEKSAGEIQLEIDELQEKIDELTETKESILRAAETLRDSQ